MAFNSNQYAWSDIKVIILGREVTGIQGVEYTPSTEKEYVYGRGSNPLGIQSGNKAVKGSIKLLQSEVTALSAAVKAANPLYNLTDVSFDLIVSYGDDTVTTDIINGVEITDYTKGMSQNDKYMEIELPFMALSVTEGA